MTTETTLDYETLEDRALDALVAERVMGLEVERDYPQGIDPECGYLDAARRRDQPAPWHNTLGPVFREKRGRIAFAVAEYSTDPAAAFMVLEAMRARSYFVGVSGSAERWNASIHHPERPGAVVAHDVSMSRAAVIAALRALDAERS